MSFSRMFPATTWLWRRVTSRPAILIYIGILVIIGVPAIALRVESAMFERRVLKAMSGLSSLRIGATTKAEVLSRMAGGNVKERARGDSDCDADECLSFTIPNSWLSDWLLLRAGRAGYGMLFSVMSRWGLRYHSLDAHVDLTGNKASRLSYQLLLSTPDPSYPGAIIINANSTSSARRYTGVFGSIGDESPDYQVSHFSKWSALRTSVYFTVDAPVELTSHAFDLKLHCVWSLAGCRTANQLLPEAEKDRLRIERAANDRLKGPNQCPERIIPGRARDTNDILLVEVKNVSRDVIVTYYGARYRVASFRPVRVLKGKINRPLENVGVSPDVSDGKIQAHNSAIDLLNPGQKLLLFSGGSTNIDEPCEAIAATASTLETIERSLGAAKLQLMK